MHAPFFSWQADVVAAGRELDAAEKAGIKKMQVGRGSVPFSCRRRMANDIQKLWLQEKAKRQLATIENKWEPFCWVDRIVDWLYKVRSHAFALSQVWLEPCHYLIFSSQGAAPLVNSVEDRANLDASEVVRRANEVSNGLLTHFQFLLPLEAFSSSPL